MTRIAIAGAAGRMGRRIAALAIAAEQFDIVSALEAAGHEALGQDAGALAGAGAFGVAVTETLTDAPDVLIDFSRPEGTLHWLDVCRAHRIRMVIGTTGLTASQAAAVADAAADVAIVRAANYSLGINVLLDVVATVAAALGPDCDVEIAEAHHRFKADAPSGTAIMLARSICEAAGKDYDASAVFGRRGRRKRRPGEIGLHALRLGDTVGEHAVHFGTVGETVTVAHAAHSRDTFARGALRAARWVADKPAGLYDVRDVLGLKR
jgi:4-hydroxy-tetrahydrodipicolinate reductase